MGFPCDHCGQDRCTCTTTLTPTNLIRIDGKSWDEGFRAGETWNPRTEPKPHNPYPVKSAESYSWLSGWIEGDAKRQGYSYSDPGASPSSRQTLSQIFMHIQRNGGKGNPFERMKMDWFVDLAEQKLSEMVRHPKDGHNPNIPIQCNSCGKPLLLENLYVDDGCPCNSPRGVNFTPQPCALCELDCCVKPGHRLEQLFGIV